MNYYKKSSFTHLKPKVHLWPILAIFSIVLTFASCDDESDTVVVEVYPSLKVENQHTDISTKAITTVSLVGYDFKSLSITKGSSQTFVLDKGMPGGYSDINVEVLFGPQGGSRSKKVNFTMGATTTITLKGCISAEGCTGFYLE